MMKPALVLVCKRPQPGMGKQRLAASLGREAANQVAHGLLACALEDVRDWPGSIIIAPSHPEDSIWADGLLPHKQPKAYVLPQANGNLGERLNALDRQLRDLGMEQLVYIGSDAPALAPADYVAVRQGLLDHDVVLKGAVDGGVVLMASRRPWPPLRALPWSSATLGIALLDCCQALGHSVLTLTSSFDVDRQDDFIPMIAALKTDLRPARRALHRLVSDLVDSVDTVSRKEERHVRF